MRRQLLLALSLSGCAHARIDALEVRVAALEAHAASRPGGAAAPGDPAQEAAAAALLTQVNDAVEDGEMAEAKALLTKFDATYANTAVAGRAARVRTELAVVGLAAPPMAVARWYTPSVGEIAPRGTTVLVFFETWCPHCQREMPNMAMLARGVPDVAFVALTKVTRTATDDAVLAMIDELSLPFPVGKEQEAAMSEALAVSGIPAAAVLHDGVVVWRGHPARLTPELLRKLSR